MTRVLPSRSSSPAIVLSVAGSDSGAGAGVQADLKTCASLNAYCVTVVTAVTAQNTRGVLHVEAISEESVRAQMRAVFDDFTIAAVKIGLIPNALIARVVAESIRAHPGVPVVLDPVGSASTGGVLTAPDARGALVSELFPQVTVLTPNVAEAFAFADQPVSSYEDALIGAGRLLLTLGPTHVLLKGGHRTGPDAEDLLLAAGGELTRIATRRLDVRNNHGSGCTLSTAIAAYLAGGASIENAVRRAKHYIQDALAGAAALKLGAGPGPLEHFFNFEGRG